MGELTSQIIDEVRQCCFKASC